MTKQELVVEALTQMGYQPSIDEDGDVKFRHKLRTYYARLGGEEEAQKQFVSLLLPKFVDVQENQIPQMLLVCNSAARSLKLVKMCLDDNLSYVHAMCDFYYQDLDSLRINLEHAMKILPLMPIWFRDRYNELSN